MRKIGAPFKACRNCKRLVPMKAERCPYCGSTDLSKDWTGLAIVLSPDSILCKELEIKEPGRYALQVR